MDRSSIGGIVRDRAVSIDRETTVDRAISAVREFDPDDGATIYYAYVTDDDQLVGVVSMRELLNADGDEPVSEVMTTDLVRITTSDTFPEAVQRFVDSEFPVLPVVDDAGEFVGVVRANDVIDELDEETTKRLFKSTWPWGAG
jgi:magnesium transporter